MTALNRSYLGVLGFLFLGVAALISQPHSAIAQSSEDPAKFAHFEDDIYRKLVSKQYQELERQFADYLKLYAVDKISESDLASKFETFARHNGLEKQFDEWVNAYPKSYSAILARAIYRISDAQNYFGSNVVIVNKGSDITAPKIKI